MTASRLCRLAAFGLLATSASAPALAQTPALATSADDLAALLSRSAPKADRHVLQLAAHAMRCALQRPELGINGDRLSVIDYSRPSTEPRLWVFDLAHQRLLFEEWVAHGRNSGENRTEHFSNRDGSFMSSLGAFTAQETYMGAMDIRCAWPGWNRASTTARVTEPSSSMVRHT